MSTQYPELGLTNFPNELDSRYIMLDPSIPSDLSAIDAYNARIAAKDMEGALKVLADNPRLSKMLFNADKWNRHEDMLLALERYYMDDVQQYLVEIVVWRGTWQRTANYAKYNVVEYEGTAYMAIKPVSMGIAPTNEEYWIPITLKGEKGDSGIGLSWRGQWNIDTSYSADDCVSYQEKLWAAKQPSIGQEPSGNSAYWDSVFSIDIAAPSLLEKLKTVDGDGSGLDADLLDGKQAAAFAATKHTHAQEDVTGLGGSLSGLTSRVEGLAGSKADKPQTYTATLTAAGWAGSKAPYTQTVSIAGVPAEGVVIVGLAANATEQQLKTCRAARIEPSGQAEGAITLKAMGVKPSIDLPISATVVK